MFMNKPEIFGMAAATLSAGGGTLTAGEIIHQPALWAKVLELFAARQRDISQFLAPLLAQKELRIILTGAGSSAFIGKCLAPAMLQKLNRRVEAIATTDLVSGPQRFFQSDVPTLLVSFARSGSSPESVAAVEVADHMCERIHHLVVTCNDDGHLYRTCRGRSNAMLLLLPPDAHDSGFAMTGSFTSMLLSAGYAFGVIDSTPGKADAIATAASDLMARALPMLTNLVERKFDRIVYLGSNELHGLAEEAALKLLELTDGRVIGSFDTPMGFRHGPKTIINSRTLVVLFLSNDTHARRYDLDLLRELQSDGRAGQVLALSAIDDIDAQANFILSHALHANDLELALPYIVFAQIFSFLQSLSLGITPDKPSLSGTVNRVVKGVRIYPYSKEA